MNMQIQTCVRARTTHSHINWHSLVVCDGVAAVVAVADVYYDIIVGIPRCARVLKGKSNPPATDGGDVDDCSSGRAHTAFSLRSKS